MDHEAINTMLKDLLAVDATGKPTSKWYAINWKKAKLTGGDDLLAFKKYRATFVQAIAFLVKVAGGDPCPYCMIPSRSPLGSPVVAMLWDVASALVRSIAFLGRLCSECSSVASEVRSAYDADVAPVFSLLGDAKDAYSRVKATAASAKDVKDRLFLANREECKEIAERVTMIQGTIDELRKQYETKPGASSSSSAPALPADLAAHLTVLNSALAAVSTLIAAQLLPASEQSWFARNKWILQQARKRDAVRSSFAAHAAKISVAMSGLGFALQVQTNGAVLQMAAASAASPINRSDLQQFQQTFAAEIEAERASWTEAQRAEIAVGFDSLLQQLEESAQKQAEAMNAGFDAAAKIAQSSDRKLDHAAGQMNDANSKLDALTAMMQAMQMQCAIVATGPASPASAASAQRPQWKYSFLELSLADLHIDFEDEDESLLGTGAAGEVWRGVWTPNLISAGGSSSLGSASAAGPSSPQHGRPTPVAFKLLKLGKLTADARLSVVRQLKREGSLMWLLNGHPNTVQLYGAVTEGKKIGLAFELCNAGTLQSHLYAISIDEQTGLSSFKPVTGPAALSAAQQLSAVSSLLQAIGFAHAKGVVHRDLKSANVLVHQFDRRRDSSSAPAAVGSSQPVASAASPSPSVALLSFKLSDFGSARALGQFAGLSAFASSMGGVGQSGGTLRWTPPELLSAQWHKLSLADQRAAENSFAVDIYALGLVIGEIFLCQPPFAQLGPQCKDAQLSNAIADPTSAAFEWSAVDSIAPKLAQLIRACCHFNPRRRPTIAELSYGLWPETMQQILSRRLVAQGPIPVEQHAAVQSSPSKTHVRDTANVVPVAASSVTSVATASSSSSSSTAPPDSQLSLRKQGPTTSMGRQRGPRFEREYSAEEVARHNRDDDCWLIIHGKVYDVTGFLVDHPGGPEILTNEAGTDATAKFEEVFHSDDARKQLNDFCVGKIDPAAAHSVTSVATATSSTAPPDTQLSLRKQGLSKLSLAAPAYAALCIVDLRENQLTDLTGSGIDQLTQLHTLDLRGNEFTSLDALVVSLRGCNALRWLYLQFSTKSRDETFVPHTYAPGVFADLRGLHRLDEIENDNCVTKNPIALSAQQLLWKIARIGPNNLKCVDLSNRRLPTTLFYTVLSALYYLGVEELMAGGNNEWSLHPQYSDVIVLCMGPKFQWLDGVAITDQRRMQAYRADKQGKQSGKITGNFVVWEDQYQRLHDEVDQWIAARNMEAAVSADDSAASAPAPASSAPSGSWLSRMKARLGSKKDTDKTQGAGK